MSATLSNAIRVSVAFLVGSPMAFGHALGGNPGAASVLLPICEHLPVIKIAQHASSGSLAKAEPCGHKDGGGRHVQLKGLPPKSCKWVA
jgi:hypothetical protein